MQKWVVVLIVLVLVSGCTSLDVESAFEISCEELIEDLPSIIAEAQTGELAKVTRIVDGDTVELEDKRKIRLIGIDTPERGDELYTEAGDSLAELILDKDVYLTTDITDKDRYGRLLRYIFTEDMFVNAEQVRLGWAESYRYEPDTGFADLFDCLEIEAEEQSLGIWFTF